MGTICPTLDPDLGEESYVRWENVIPQDDGNPGGRSGGIGSTGNN